MNIVTEHLQDLSISLVNKVFPKASQSCQDVKEFTVDSIKLKPYGRMVYSLMRMPSRQLGCQSYRLFFAIPGLDTIEFDFDYWQNGKFDYS